MATGRPNVTTPSLDGSLHLGASKNLHVRLLRCTVIPCALDEVAKVWHIFLDGCLPEVRTVLEHAEHVVDVKEWSCALGFDQDHGFILRHADAKFEHHIWIMLGQIRYHNVRFNQVVDYRGLNQIATLPVGSLDRELRRSRSRRNQAAQHLGKETSGMLGIALNEG